MKKIGFFLLLIVSITVNACADGKKGSGNDKNVIILANEKDFDKIISGTTPVIVDFHAEWCKPCKIQGPILDEIAGEMDGKVIILKVDVDKFPNISSRFEVTGIPTLLMFKAGKQVWKGVGLRQKEDLKAVITQNL